MSSRLSFYIGSNIHHADFEILNPSEIMYFEVRQNRANLHKDAKDNFLIISEKATKLLFLEEKTHKHFKDCVEVIF